MELDETRGVFLQEFEAMAEYLTNRPRVAA